MSDQLNTSELLTFAVEAVHKAGDVVSAGDPGRVTDKGDRDLSTEMDLASEHAVRELLQKRTSEIPLLGEEEGGPDPSIGLVWVLDPIDGTVNYVHQLPSYAVALSLIDNGQTVVAATYLPATQTIYTATADGGSKAGDLSLQASKTSVLSESLIAIDQFTFVDDDPEEVNALRLKLIERLTPVVHRIRINGSSAVDLAWTAQGKLDACIMLANKPWDTSAGVLIAREAGAVASDLEGNQHHLDSATTLAAAPHIADAFFKAISEATT